MNCFRRTAEDAVFCPAIRIFTTISKSLRQVVDVEEWTWSHRLDVYVDLQKLLRLLSVRAGLAFSTDTWPRLRTHCGERNGTFLLRVAMPIWPICEEGAAF